MSVYLRVTSLTAALLLTAGVGAAQEPAGVHQIAEHVYSYTSGGGNHSLFVVGDYGIAIFETYDSRHSEAMLAAIRAISDKPIRYAFHSHNHWDHSSGGQVFRDAGAQTVMHKLAAQWLTAHPGRDTTTPDIVWEGSRRDFVVGDFTVELRYLGLNHGLGMTVFTIPRYRAAFLADLVNPNRVMFSVVPDFNIGEWERSLTEVLELDFEIAVCSHNELPPMEAKKGCTKGHVEEERQFIRDLRTAILAEFEKGTSFLEVPKAVRLPQYESWVGYDQWLEMNTLRLMTDLWMGPFPWHPPGD